MRCSKKLSGMMSAVVVAAVWGGGVSMAARQAQPGDPGVVPADRPGERPGVRPGDRRVQSGGRESRPGEQAATPRDRRGSDADDIRKAVARAADAALTKDGIDSIVARLVDADRNRLVQTLDLTDEQERTLDGRIEQIRQAWKAKYGEEFRARRFVNYMTTARVEEGVIGRDARLAAEVIRNSETALETGPGKGRGTGQPANPAAPNVPGNRGSGNVLGDRQYEPTPGATTRGGTDTSVLGAPEDRWGNKAADQNIEEGRDIAVVTLSAAGGLPEIRVPMIQEFPDSWQVNVPDRVTGSRLYDNLLKQLTALGESADKWPANADEAYRLVTSHVIYALLDVEHASDTDSGSSAIRQSAPDSSRERRMESVPATRGVDQSNPERRNLGQPGTGTTRPSERPFTPGGKPEN